MGRALDHVLTQVLTTSQGHRLGTDALVIVLTDGGSLEAEGTVKEAADNLRSIGVRIVGETKKEGIRPPRLRFLH
jgi:EAL domain-containing protein (putative c-di-GMP-specific phosphodiesterase class I)